MSNANANYNPDPIQPDRWNRYGWGLLSGLLLQLLQWPLGLALMALGWIVPATWLDTIAGIFLYGAAVTQCVYIIPVWLYQRRRKRTLFNYGLLTAAFIFFLLAGYCGVYFIVNPPITH